ncbi:MAG: TRAP transporter small permease [Desulfobacteraceae bacterium]|nr:TRAP transporter small permease [Desulfobacteraceae bacterium]
MSKKEKSLKTKSQIDSPKKFNKFGDLLNVGATVAWLLIVFITFIDVVMRYLLSSSIPGGYEIIKTLMAIGIFLSLPIAALRHAHVKVELLVQNLSKQWQSRSTKLGGAVGALFFGLITWRVYMLTVHSYESGEVTTYLRLPLWWVMVIMVILGVVTTVCCAVATASGFGKENSINGK